MGRASHTQKWSPQISSQSVGSLVLKLFFFSALVSIRHSIMPPILMVIFAWGPSESLEPLLKPLWEQVSLLLLGMRLALF